MKGLHQPHRHLCVVACHLRPRLRRLLPRPPLSTASADAKPIASISTSARFNRPRLGLRQLKPVPRAFLLPVSRTASSASGTHKRSSPALPRADAQLIKKPPHTPVPVRGLDFNPLQPKPPLQRRRRRRNLHLGSQLARKTPILPALAPRNSTKSPRSPGTARCPHVLATSSSSGYTVVWDLKGKREVVALQYGGGAGTAGGALGSRLQPPAAPWLPVAVAA
ncbi:hypothetical protein L1887_51859 [Cichorium endivia]|nr:hypothetical protein L1887_51859 [Cichorium endivia]